MIQEEPSINQFANSFLFFRKNHICNNFLNLQHILFDERRLELQKLQNQCQEERCMQMRQQTRQLGMPDLPYVQSHWKHHDKMWSRIELKLLEMER